MTDDYDKRLLNTFARAWFGDFMFEPDFEFYTMYKIMRFRSIDAYLEQVNEMAVVDPPQAYGLHPNADIT